MFVGELEKRIENNLKWQRIEDIPEFPAKSFVELRKRVTLGEISLGIDFTVANQLAQSLYGRKYTLTFLALAWVPYFAGLVAIALAIALRSYVWLAALPIIFVAELGSNPYNPLRPLFNLVAVLSVVILVVAGITGSTLTAGLLAFFAIPFFANRTLYKRNQEKLRQVALNSEKILIYLYQSRKLGVMDATGKAYWHPQA